MPLRTIALLGVGDMGSGVGRALAEHGHDVVTCLAGRSEATRTRAKQAGFRDLADLESLVAEADIVLSILPPEAAPGVAREVAAAMTASGVTPPYVDCNAVSPQTARAIGETVAAAGAEFIDGGVIGLSPGKSDQPVRFYVSGPNARLMSELDGKGIDVRVSGTEIGTGSAIKMCYAAVTKGTSTLHTAALIAAEAMGVGDAVRAEFEYSLPAVYQRMRGTVPRLPVDAGRWIGEMKEIARTFEAAGVTPQFHRGALEIFELLASTPIASETRETLDRSRTMEQAVRIYLDHLPAREAAE